MPSTSPQTAAPDRARAAAPGRGRAGRVGFACVLLLLLLAPLVGTELYLRRQAVWLRPELRRFPVAMDLKFMMARRLAHCPDAVTFGTSLSDRGLPPFALKGKKIAGVKIQNPFDFASAGIRGTTMLAQYEWMRGIGCTPTLAIVEVSPVVLNAAVEGKMHDAAVMSATGLLRMPDGFAEAREYDTAKLIELATYDRLLIQRRRESIQKRFKNHFELDGWFASEQTRSTKEFKDSRTAWSEKKKLPADGKITGYGKGFNAQRLRAQVRKRRKQLRKGKFKFELGKVEVAALNTLIDRALADGVTVLLHSPPTHPLYNDDIAVTVGIIEAYLPFRRSFMSELGKRHPAAQLWQHDAFRSPELEDREFTDWIHLSKRGAKAYVKRLAAEAKPLSASIPGDK